MVVEAMATELKTMPQILSTQVIVVPAVAVVCALGSMVLVAQGIVIQSVEQEVPTTLPTAIVPPVTLNAMEGVLAGIFLLIESKLSYKIFGRFALSTARRCSIVLLSEIQFMLMKNVYDQ
jgi:hypothetical protein